MRFFKLIAAGVIAFIPTSAAFAAPMWVLVNRLYRPDQGVQYYTNFDVSSIVRNGNQVFANTKYTNDLNSRESEKITIVNCKEKTIVDGTSFGRPDKHVRRNNGEWWDSDHSDDATRWSHLETISYFADSPTRTANLKQSELRFDKRYEAMFNFLCNWE